MRRPKEPTSKRKLRRGLFGMGLFRIGILLAGLLWWGPGGGGSGGTLAYGQTGEAGGELVRALETRVQQVLAECERSVVAIARLPRDDGEQGFQIPQFQAPTLGRLGPQLGGLGSSGAVALDADFVPSDFGAGVVLDHERRIVTAYHVIGRIADSQFFVWSAQRPFRARVLAADPWTDLAVLQVEGGDFRPIPLGKGDQVAQGQFVVALGNPQAIGRDGRLSAAWGLVANRLRRAPRTTELTASPAARETLHHHGTLLQTDARLDPGFRGGALLNLQGELIGLLTAYSGGAREARFAGFAIPVDETFRTAVDQLKAGKVPEFGFLGVGPQSPGMDYRIRQQGRHGVAVETVLAGSPAARAGIQVGDVITHAAGQVLYDDDDLFRVVGAHPPTYRLPVTVFRGDFAQGRGERLERVAVLEKKRVVARRPEYSTAPPERWRGLQVDYASIAVHENVGLAERIPAEGCVYVVSVERDSPVWQAGVRRGMFVTQIVAGGPVTHVATPAEFFAAARRAAGEAVTLRALNEQGAVSTHTVSP
ncbi:MAG: S1C family serine protease [Pirellulaceae bacterium]